MTKDQILADLYNSAKLNDMVQKFNAGGGNEDLKSELFAVLCEKHPDKIVELHNKGQLMYFATGIVQRMIFQKGSKFARMYRSCVYEYTDAMLSAPDESGWVDKEKALTDLDKGIDSLHWVEQKMLEIWQEEGDLVSISRKTTIPYRQVKKIISNAKNKLVSEISGKLYGNYVVASLDIVLDCEDNITPDNINDLLEDLIEYLKQRAEQRQIPSKTLNKSFVKEIRPAKLKKII